MMKSTTLFYIFSILLLALLFSCKSDPKVEQTETPPTEESNPKIAGNNPSPKSTLTLVTFYDFNAQRSYMDYRRVKIKESSGDIVRDAVATYLGQNRIGNDLNRFKLDQIKMENGTATFMISGLSKVKNHKSKDLFKIGLDSTIIYNYPNKKFKIEVNGQTL